MGCAEPVALNEHHGLGIRRGNDLGDDSGLGADDDRSLRRTDRCREFENMPDHGTMGDRMQHLRQGGPHPRALPGGQNNHQTASRIHSQFLRAICQFCAGLPRF